mgnify:CR=1 FL=1
MLLLAIVTITLALVMYSVGVWGETLQGILRLWHVVIFWLGFACDTAGTTLMSLMAEGQGLLSFHGITGGIAILLMLFHSTWATVVLVRKKETMMRTFHRLSLIVWIIWLIPYFSGVIVGMGA